MLIAEIKFGNNDDLFSAEIELQNYKCN